jgi:DNA-binding MarR family transcriptional regulator
MEAPLAPAIDPEGTAFLVLDLARLFRAEFERRVEAARLGVTPAEARVLAHMARLGPAPQHVLAERLGVARMSLTGFLDRLERAGLVERRVDARDRRAKEVRLTPAAEDVLAGIATVGLDLRAAARAGIPDADWERFRTVALAVRANLAAQRAAAEAGR